MPNYCHNELYFNQKGALEAVIEFMGEKFDFNKLIPYPQEFARRDADAETIRVKYGKLWSERTQADVDAERAEWERFTETYGSTRDGFNTGGIEWCRENWGTKWNASDGRVEGDHIAFNTAWSPPIPVIVALAKHFPQYTFHLEYFEQGAAFCGGFSCPNEDDYYEDDTWHPGVVTSEWRGEYRGHKGG